MDRMKRAVGLLLAFSIVGSAQNGNRREAHWLDPDRSEPAGTKYGSFPSKLAGSEVSYLIYLPPDYATATSRRYPVVTGCTGRAARSGRAQSLSRRSKRPFARGTRRP
jgi:hypothetical protein